MPQFTCENFKKNIPEAETWQARLNDGIKTNLNKLAKFLSDNIISDLELSRFFIGK